MLKAMQSESEQSRGSTMNANAECSVGEPQQPHLAWQNVFAAVLALGEIHPASRVFCGRGH